MNNKELPGRLDAIHGVVLPLKCNVNDPSPLAWIRNLKDAIGPYKARVYIGVDDCDYSIWREWEDEAGDALGLLQVHVQVFERSKPAKICKIWSLLGHRAVQDGCQYVILWGDDVRIDYPQDFLPSLHLALDCDELGCAAPIDAADPSVPTFPIVTAKHFNVFKALFPADFINQDADGTFMLRATFLLRIIRLQLLLTLLGINDFLSSQFTYLSCTDESGALSRFPKPES